MPGFSVSPVGPFPPVTSEEFPDFLQWQWEGVDVGDTTVDTVNLTGDVTVSVGTGEETNVLSIAVVGGSGSGSLQFQEDGVDLGAADANTVDFGLGLNASRAGDTISVDGLLSWRDVPGDTTLAITDTNNGLSCSGTTGTQNVTIPLDTGDDAVDLPIGAAVLVYGAGAAGVSFAVAGGVTLNVRSALSAALAGEFATATLIKRSANNWIACGDLAAA